MSSELGSNLIPQYTDFTVRFSSITQDGQSFNFTGSAWVFAMDNDFEGTPIVLKSSTGSPSSGDFAIDNVNKNISVRVRASEINFANGQYYVALFRYVSGTRIGHEQKYITILPQLNPTGIPV